MRHDKENCSRIKKLIYLWKNDKQFFSKVRNLFVWLLNYNYAFNQFSLKCLISFIPASLWKGTTNNFKIASVVSVPYYLFNHPIYIVIIYYYYIIF